MKYNNIVTNTFLRIGGNSFSNNSPVVTPYDITLIGMSLSTNAAETWIGSIWVNGATGATLSVTAADSAYASNYSLGITAGSKISFYCAGSTVDRPNLTGWFRRDS